MKRFLLLLVLLVAPGVLAQAALEVILKVEELR